MLILKACKQKLTTLTMMSSCVKVVDLPNEEISESSFYILTLAQACC